MSVDSYAIIANPVSGGGRALKVAALAAGLARRAGADADVLLTSGPGHARQLASEALARGVDCIVACGGDGTIQEAAGVLAGGSAPLGILPCGRCNDLARALGIPTRPSRAIAMLLGGGTRKVDIGKVNGKPFLTVATFGFDAEVSQAIRQGASPLSGTPAYLHMTMKRLWSFRCPAVRLSGDFGRYEGRAFLVATGNTSSYGGGMRIAPSAVPDDGLLDVCIVSEISPASVLLLLPRVFWGGHVTHPAVRIEKTARLDIETDGTRFLDADGELIGQTPAALTVEPGALTVICGGWRQEALDQPKPCR